MKEYDPDTCAIHSSKHFKNTWLRKWGWDYVDLRNAIRDAYKVDKIGKRKYEAWVRKKGLKKIVFVYYAEFDTIFVITGTEVRK